MVERIDVRTLRIRIPPDYLDSDIRTPMGGYGKFTADTNQISIKNTIIHSVSTETVSTDDPYTIGQFSYYAINPFDISDIPPPVSAPRAVFEVVIPKRDTIKRVQTRPSHRSKSACEIHSGVQMHAPMPPHPLARPPLHPTHRVRQTTTTTAFPIRPPGINSRQQTTSPLPLLSAIDLHSGNIAILIEAEISEYLTAIVSIMREYRVEISGNKFDPYNNFVCYPETLTASALNQRIHHTCTYMYNMEYFSYLYAIGLDLRNYNFNSFISNEIHGIVIKDMKHPSEVCFYKYPTPKKITIQELCELIYRAFPKYATNTIIQVVGAHVHREILFIKAYVDN